MPYGKRTTTHPRTAATLLLSRKRRLRKRGGTYETANQEVVFVAKDITSAERKRLYLEISQKLQIEKIINKYPQLIPKIQQDVKHFEKLSLDSSLCNYAITEAFSLHYKNQESVFMLAKFEPDVYCLVYTQHQGKTVYATILQDGAPKGAMKCNIGWLHYKDSFGIDPHSNKDSLHKRASDFSYGQINKREISDVLDRLGVENKAPEAETFATRRRLAKQKKLAAKKKKQAALALGICTTIGIALKTNKSRRQRV